MVVRVWSDAMWRLFPRCAVTRAAAAAATVLFLSGPHQTRRDGDADAGRAR